MSAEWYLGLNKLNIPTVLSVIHERVNCKKPSEKANYAGHSHPDEIYNIYILLYRPILYISILLLLYKL